jgi:hypothetical protein
MHISLNNFTSAALKKLISIVERKKRAREELREIESKLSTHLSPEPATPTVRIRRGKSRSVRGSKRPLEVKASKSKVQQAEAKSRLLNCMRVQSFGSGLDSLKRVLESAPCRNRQN